MNLVPARADSLPAKLRGFGPLGLLAIAVIVLVQTILPPLGALLVLVWAWLSCTPWKEIGYASPKSWFQSLALGVAFGISLKFAMKAIVMPLFGADPINRAFHYLAGNRAALPEAIYLMIVVAGFGEETFFRGYGFERLRKLMGSSRASIVATVVLTSVWFGSAHYAVQGASGVEQATIVGLIFGSIYAATQRIWLLVAAHAAFDLTALVMIYLDLETRVAHLVFK